MNWAEIISQIVLPIVGLIVSTFLVPWLRENHMSKYALLAVQAAEQMFGGGTGKDKYAYASGLLVSKFHLSDKEAKRLVESAVYQLGQVHTALETAAAQPVPASQASDK